VKIPRKPAILTVAVASLAALVVAGGGVASASTGAEITNMCRAETGHGACLTAQSPGTAITQE
jgi:hypothetical protein